MVARWKTDMPTDRLRFYCTAMMLDPRHNNMQFPGLTNAFRAIARDWFISEFDALWRVDEEEPDSSGSDGEQPTTGKKKHAQHEGASFIDFLDQLNHLETEESGEDGDDDDDEVVVQKSEVERYLELPPVSKSTDLLQWWARHENEFPSQLSRMAMQYLGCPATSASAERLFSIAGRVYDDLRQNMGEDMLEEIMWARINCAKRKGV